MAIVTATVTDCPHTTFSAAAQWDDADLLDIFNSVRHRTGKIPTGAVDESGEPITRDMTNAECARRMVGSMMQEWAKFAAIDKADRLAREAAASVTTPTWITLS